MLNEAAVASEQKQGILVTVELREVTREMTVSEIQDFGKVRYMMSSYLYSSGTLGVVRFVAFFMD